MTCRRFPHHAHLRTPAEYSRCFASGKRAGGRYFLCVFRADDETDADTRTVPVGTRLGMAVSKKVDRRAVERNRLRRLVREWFRHRRHEFLPGDLVVVGKPAARGASAAAIFSDLNSICARLPIEAGDRSRHNAGFLAAGEANSQSFHKVGVP